MVEIRQLLKKLLNIIVVFLIPSICFAWGGPSFSLTQFAVSGGTSSAPNDTEIGITTAFTSSDTTTKARMVGNSTGDPNAFTTPAGGLTVSHGYFYGNTADGGTNGTFTMAIFAADGTTQVGSCSASGTIVDGNSPAWNEVTWSPAISLSGSTAYKVAVYPSEEYDYFYETVTSGDGAHLSSTILPSCPTTITSNSTNRITASIANYACHTVDPVYGDTFYVAQTATGNGSGSDTSNYMSVASHNAGSFDPGDTIYLSGTITSQVTPPSSGTSTRPIVYDGYEAGSGTFGAHASSTVIDRNGGAYGIYLDAKDYITIRDLEITDFYDTNLSGGAGIYGKNGCDHITIENNTIHNGSTRGIFFTAGTGETHNTNITIGGATGKGNKIYDIPYNGISFGSTAADDYATACMDVELNKTREVTISYNAMYGTSSGATGTGVDGILFERVNLDDDEVATGDSFLIEYNKIYAHNFYANGSNRGENAIDIKHGSNNGIIRYNDCYGHEGQSEVLLQMDSFDIDFYHNNIHDAGKAGLLVYDSAADGNTIVGQGPKDINIYGNLFYDIDGSGIRFYTGSSADHPEASNAIFNNTFVRTAWDNSLLSSDAGFAIHLSTGTGYTVKNNILYNNRVNYSNGNTWTQSYFASLDSGDVDFDYNYYYWNDGTYHVTEVYYDSNDYTIAEAKALSPARETNGADDDPEFVNSASNYTPNVGAPIISAGLDMGTITLFDAMPDFSDANPSNWSFSTADPDSVGWDIGAILND